MVLVLGWTYGAYFMLHDICSVLYDERVEFGLVACCGLGYDKGLNRALFRIGVVRINF